MDRRKRTARTVALMSLFSMTDIQQNVSVASFDGDGSDLVSLIVRIEPVQTGSGDPSPDNVRPISGWTECKVTRTGKNLFDKSAITPNSWIVVNSTEIAPAIDYFVSDYIPVIAGKKIICTHRGASRAAYYDKWKNPISYVSWNGGVLTPLYDGYIRITDTNDHLDTLQVELGSTATSYEAYQGTTYTIDLDGTRYGGTLDVTTGKLTVDRAETTYSGDGTDWSVTTGSGYIQFYFADQSIDPANMLNLISNRFPAIETTERASKSGLVKFNDKAVRISLTTAFAQDNRISDKESFNTWLSSNPVSIVYPLATPIVYDLTPTEINTLLGANNIWADTGEIKYIEYNV